MLVKAVEQEEDEKNEDEKNENENDEYELPENYVEGDDYDPFSDL